MSEKRTEQTAVEKRKLYEMNIEREANALLLNAKSEIIEEYMKSVSGGAQATGHGTWGEGMQYYKIPSFPVENDGSYHKVPTINQWGMENIIDMTNGKSNFSFIRAVGLKDGVKIQYPGIFLLKDIKHFTEDFKNFITKFYLNYMKIIKFRIEVTTEE